MLRTSTDVGKSGTADRGDMNLKHAVEQLFRPATSPGRIGAEVELIPVTEGDSPAPVDPRVLAAGFDTAFRTAAVPSFEPGGQLELSPPPQPTAAALTLELQRLIGRAQRLCAERGVRLLGVGTNPYHSCAEVPLRAPTPRYVAMQELFDRVGPDGRRMMRLTASLQITVDLLPGAAGREQWLVANLAGPALTAAFANSPWRDGRPAGIPGARTRIWQGVDHSRTGYDGRHLDLVDPVGAYLAFAASAARLPIPEAARSSYHLSTLFPPVRPRGGYLELRYLDAQPVQRLGEVIGTVSRLLYDRRARRDALDLLLPLAGEMSHAWDQAAVGICAQTADLLEIASPSDRTLASVHSGWSA
jgi:glutamate--cysteine ligase